MAIQRFGMLAWPWWISCIGLGGFLALALVDFLHCGLGGFLALALVDFFLGNFTFIYDLYDLSILIYCNQHTSFSKYLNAHTPKSNYVSMPMGSTWQGPDSPHVLFCRISTDFFKIFFYNYISLLQAFFVAKHQDRHDFKRWKHRTWPLSCIFFLCFPVSLLQCFLSLFRGGGVEVPTSGGHRRGTSPPTPRTSMAPWHGCVVGGPWGGLSRIPVDVSSLVFERPIP